MSVHDLRISSRSAEQVTQDIGMVADVDVRSLADLPIAQRNQIIGKLAREGHFDFLDFGTHKGGGLRKGLALGGRLGLGVDLNDNKVKALLSTGLAAYSGNVLDFDVPGSPFSFAICRHVLEHMPNKYAVGVVLDKLSQLCKDYIFIEQPSFDHDAYLARHGLVLSPSTLEYHTCRMSIEEIFVMLRDLGLRRFVIGGQTPVLSSADPKIFRADAPPNRMVWKQETDAPKPDVQFPPNLYRNIIVVIALSDSVDPARVAENGGARKIQLASHY